MNVRIVCSALAGICWLVTPLAAAGDPERLAACFEGESSEGIAATTDTQANPYLVAPASWSGGCAEDCGCGDTCAAGCCGGACACCGIPNCGLLGQGLLTYDPCAAGCPLPKLLLGCFRESEGCFDDFISPMTNPVFFEDPRNVTELRGIYLNHNVPAAAGGGDIQLYAVQIRARLTDRLSLIATKDGYAVSDNPLIDDGWADVSLGLKYGLYRDPANQLLVSTGAVYELPVGSTRTLQAGGDGTFNPFLTSGAQLFDRAHWLSGFGGVIPANQNDNASLLYWSNHFDYQVRRGWYGLMEFNWYHWAVDGENRLGLTGVEGGDLFNFGSDGVAGNDIVTGAFGAKYKPNRKTELGIAWENPLTERRDVLDSRLTVDLILRY